MVNPPRFHAIKRIQQFAYLLDRTLRHADDLSKTIHTESICQTTA